MPKIDARQIVLTSIGHQSLRLLFARIRVNRAKVFNGSPCWEWQRSLDKDGYGVVKASGKPYRAHQAVATFFGFPVPAG